MDPQLDPTRKRAVCEESRFSTEATMITQEEGTRGVMDTARTARDRGQQAIIRRDPHKTGAGEANAHTTHFARAAWDCTRQIPVYVRKGA